ncbi:cubilin-like isoform X2 [Rhopilema esculentum]|uniref:cubilin-like isoform X2 n=1 Tax=Rhopilema esculentum TaxID=499914 RepID=UPI0031E02176
MKVLPILLFFTIDVAVFRVNEAINCGQTFMFKTGVISSPNFPAEPPSMLRQCINTIKAQNGQSIQLQFLEVTDMPYYFCYGSRLSVFEGNAEAASFCYGLKDLHSTFLSSGTEIRLVYTRNIFWPTSFKFRLRYTIIEEAPFDPARCLFIYEGYVSNRTIAKTQCGDDTAQFLSTNNDLVLTYEAKSDGMMIENPGFQIYYSIGVQGCDQFFTRQKAEILSPLYPSPYPRNANCAYNISSHGNKHIYIEFLTVDLNPGATLQIFERMKSNGQPQLTALNPLNRVYLSAGNSVVIVFRSDNGLPSGGFRLQYVILEGCSLILRRPAYIASPLFSSSYPNGVECNYTFQYPSTMFPVRALFSLIQLNIESQQDCDADSLSIYEGSSKNDFLLDKVCGIRSGITYMASGREIFTQFLSNANVTTRGFLAYFSAVNITCNSSYDAPEGSIQSVNFPNPYPNKLICTTKIQTEYGNKVMLDFTYFELESSINCTKDSLEIYDGSIAAKNLRAKRCGNQPWSYVSKTGTIFLKFHSDQNVSKRGYSMHYETCGGLFQSSYEHRFRSPGFPRPYPNECNCRYEVYGQHGFGVRLVFLRFSLEKSFMCKNDYIKVYEGIVSNRTLLATRCGNNNKEVFGKPGKLIVIFKTNKHLPGLGFNIYAQACSVLLTEKSGTLYSPYFPSRYPPGIFCTYAIRMQEGTRIKLLFSNFTIDTRYNMQRKDCLQVYDGLNSKASLARNMSGTSRTEFLSSGNSVFLELRTFFVVWNVWSGFKIQYSVDQRGPCDVQSPCMNNASCTNTQGGSYRCKCPASFIGRNCSIKIRPCDSNPCPKNRICKEVYSGPDLQYSCECGNGLRAGSCRKNSMTLTNENKLATVISPLVIICVVAAVLIFCSLKTKNRKKQKIEPIELDGKKPAGPSEERENTQEPKEEKETTKDLD